MLSILCNVSSLCKLSSHLVVLGAMDCSLSKNARSSLLEDHMALQAVRYVPGADVGT